MEVRDAPVHPALPDPVGGCAVYADDGEAVPVQVLPGGKVGHPAAAAGGVQELYPEEGKGRVHQGSARAAVRAVQRVALSVPLRRGEAKLGLVGEASGEDVSGWWCPGERAVLAVEQSKSNCLYEFNVCRSM